MYKLRYDSIVAYIDYHYKTLNILIMGTPDPECDILNIAKLSHLVWLTRNFLLKNKKIVLAAAFPI